jgi:tetratricopeptide (TPR) repeat protein
MASGTSTSCVATPLPPSIGTTRALQRDWRLSKAHLQIGMIYRSLGAYTAAEAALRAGLQESPSDPLLLVNLSAIELSQGDRWRAQALLRELDHLSIASAETSEIVAAARNEIAGPSNDHASATRGKACGQHVLAMQSNSTRATMTHDRASDRGRGAAVS